MAKWSSVAGVSDQAEPGLYLSMVRGEQISQRMTLNATPGNPQDLSGFHITANCHFRLGLEEAGRPVGPFTPLMSGGSAVPDATLDVVTANQTLEPGVFHVNILSTLLPAGVEIAIDSDIIPMAFVAITINDGASPTPNIDVTRFVISWRSN